MCTDIFHTHIQIQSKRTDSLKRPIGVKLLQEGKTHAPFLVATAQEIPHLPFSGT